MSEDRVLRALRALAENDRAAEAPPVVEARLRAALRARRMRRRSAWLALGAVAAGVAIAMVFAPSRAALPDIGIKPPLPPVVEAARPGTIAASRRAPRVTHEVTPGVIPSATPATDGAAPPLPREVVTDFFSLMESPPPFERGQLLRVNVPAAAMRTVGLPVREEHMADPIQADVLVGEEGIPRAIRFVRFEVK